MNGKLGNNLIMALSCITLSASHPWTLPSGYYFIHNQLAIFILLINVKAKSLILLQDL